MVDSVLRLWAFVTLVGVVTFVGATTAILIYNTRTRVHTYKMMFIMEYCN